MGVPPSLRVASLAHLHPNLYMGSLAAARESRKGPVLDQHGEAVTIAMRVSVCRHKVAWYDDRLVLRDSLSQACAYDAAARLARRLWVYLRFGNILVHCNEGRNRSAFLCLVYASLTAPRITMAEAMEQLRLANAHRHVRINANPALLDCVRRRWPTLSPSRAKAARPPRTPR